MALNLSSQISPKGILEITLSGDLDANTAPAFKAEIESAAAKQAMRVVLMLKDLDYMASAGIRMLVFARQKMGAEVDIFVVAPRDEVRETLVLTGLGNSLYILDEYDAVRIENF